MKELTTRGYLDAADETVDCLLLFIPNEQVYAFVQEHDRAILDDAMRHKIVVCSPLTLYAVLAVVRQAVDNFRLERTSSEILDAARRVLAAVGGVRREDGQARPLAHDLRRDFDELTGTRRRMLDAVDKIDDLRRSKELAASDDATLPGDPPLALEA